MEAATAAQKKKYKKKGKDDKDPVQEKITNFLEEVKEKGERRNAYANLAQRVSSGEDIVGQGGDYGCGPVSAGPADRRGGRN